MFKFNLFRVSCSFIVLVALFFAATVTAQNKVVVIPLGGDDGEDLPRFRIVSDSGNAAEGRLEFSLRANSDDADLWGTVCDDTFNLNDNAANAICMDMGFQSGSYVSSGSGLGADVLIALDGVDCPAGATSFSQCSSNQVGDTDCDHSEDVIIACDGELTAQSIFNVNDLRIVPEPGGLGPNDGRLELLSSFNSSFSGTVCDDQFDSNDNAANAVCQDLGFSGGVLRDRDDITDGDGKIALDDVDCALGALSLAECDFVVVNDDCSSTEDVGVICGVEARLASEYFNYVNGSLNGGSPNAGVGFSNSWDGSLNVVDGVAETLITGFASSFRTLSDPVAPIAGNSLYVSFDFQASTNLNNDFAGLSFFAGSIERVLFGLPFNTNNYGVGAFGTIGAGDDSGMPVVQSLQRLVGGIEFGATITELELYLDGTLIHSRTVNTSGFNNIDIDRIRLGSGSSAARFDNIFISTERCDVLECLSM